MSSKNKIILYIAIIISLINFSKQGNGLDVQNQLILMPYPAEATLNWKSEDVIQVEQTLSLKTNSETCTGDCKTFLTDNFNDIIIEQIKVKEQVTDFRVSLHEAIDLPRTKFNVKTTIPEVTLNFKEDKLETIYPTLKIGIDESYNLDITTESIIIEATTVFGAKYAFETLNQLIRINNENHKCIIIDLPVSIKDKPRFQWRGLMIDPARNPLPHSYYKRIIDALSGFKSNVLHIHLGDAQNFVFESKKHPELSAKGVFDQKRVLTQEFLKEIIEYGKKKGVIIYGGLNFPSHMGAIGLAYPNAVCDLFDYILDNDFIEGENYISLNPAESSTLNIVEDIIDEISSVFGSDYVHVGGEMVPSFAWTESKNWNDIRKWMSDHQMENTAELENYFNSKTQNAVLGNKKIPIVYQDVFEDYNAKKEAIVHVWSNKAQIKTAVNAGHKVIISEGFELNKQQPYCHYYDKSQCNNIYMYVWNNRRFLDAKSIQELDDTIEQGVLGGEGSAWGESVDEQNFFEVVFQRFGAIAERFWSPKDIVNPSSHEVRANYVRCLLLRNGILLGAGPLYHAICDLIGEHQ